MNLLPISLVIPSWNGRELLARNLPALFAALHRYGGPQEVVLVDDGSTDGTAEFVSGAYPSVRIVRRPRNGGFSAAVNDGIAAARFDHLLLLNTDIEVEPGFLQPLVEGFVGDGGLFAASSLQLCREPGGRCFPDGHIAMRVEAGHLLFEHDAHADRIERPVRQAIANGGCSLFHRPKLLELGGLCALFNPFYYEDTEISLQALLRGWHSLFVPASRVRHEHGASTRARRLLFATAPVRNYLYLHWLVLDSSALWRAFLRDEAVRLCVWPLRGRGKYALCALWAGMHVPAVLRWRRRRQRGKRKSLESVLREYART